MKGKIIFIVALCIFLTGLLYGCVEEEKEENQSPTCNLDSNHFLGTAPLTVTFTLTASDSDGTISSWKLDIDNDGSADYSGTGNPPSTQVHTYASQGSYTAKLTVTDNEEKTDTDTITITVNEPTIENQSPICTLSVAPSSGYVPLMVTFSMDVYDPDGTISSWSLDINNNGTVDYSGTGTPSNTQEHTYSILGIYTAKLTVIDNQGASGTGTTIVNVTEEPSENQSPTCSLTVNHTSSTVPLSVTFVMSASDSDGSISTWSLDINNDGASDYAGSGTPPATQQHIYQTNGTYTASLTVTDNNGTSSSVTIVITASEVPLQNQPPTCTLSANISTGYAPLSIAFILSGNDPDGTIVSWALDINNDGTPEYSGAGTPPSTKQHTYEDIGTFTATLNVTDNDGVTSTDTKIIIVNQALPQNQPPTCTLTANPTSGPAPLLVTFTMNASDPDGTIATWALDINNYGIPEYTGSGEPPMTQQYTYINSLTFTAKLTVTDNDGAEHYDIVTITVLQETGESYKNSCREDITYAQLNSNPDSYIGERITYKGQIVQVIDQGSAYRIDVGSGDIVYVTKFSISAYNEDDYVQVWGEVQGSYTYISIFWGVITIPHIEAKYMEEITFKLNLAETAKWKNLEVTVKSALNTSSYTYTGYSGTVYTEEADPDRTFIILDVNVKVTGAESEYVSGYDFWLYDSEGYKYDYDSGTYSIDGGLEGTTIYQNQQVDGKILFDVPISASGLKAQYNLELFNPLLVEWALNL